VDFFVYSRDAAGTGLRAEEALLEEHWSCMDAFAQTMIARRCGGTRARLGWPAVRRAAIVPG
jgi:hypothetical protein